jgi:hypothetical protein
MRYHKTDLVKRDFFGNRIFDQAQSFRAKFRVCRLDLDTFGFSDPRRLKLQPAFFDQIGNQTADGRELPLANIRNLFQTLP